MVTDKDTGDIDDSQRIIRRSTYDVDMERWLQYFSLDQFHFIKGGNLVTNPVEELQKVERFLGIRHILTKDLFYFDETKGFYCMCATPFKRNTNADKRVAVDQKCLGDSKGRTHPLIDSYVVNKLREFFRPHNERLYKMIGINFA